MVDYTVIGAGIIGLATAYELTQKHASASVLVLEKEDDIAQHQSGNNSGVIHSGIYYKPGSLKARNCRAGKKLLEQFARDNNIAYEICGKVIVACDAAEELRLKDLFERGKQNDVKVEWFDARGLRDLEPHVQGIAAVYVPEAGIIDYPAMCRALASHIVAAGGEIRTGARVKAIRRSSDSVLLELEEGTVETVGVVNCAGLYSDVLAKQSGEQLQHQIVPFRGEYYELVPGARSLVNNLVYPVPDPRFPFLGVHFTRMISGAVECGPNAVLALAREGYSWKAFNSAEFVEVLRYPGFWQLVRKYPIEGASEMLRSLSKCAFLKALNRLIPDLRMQDIVPHGAGVRAQAVMKNGSMLDDFLFAGSDGITHVLNAPSPGATASLAIAKAVVAQHTGEGS